MKWTECMVQKNNEVWEEMHGASKYAKMAQKAKEMGHNDDMNMYIDMAEQELGHADKIKTAARRMLDRARNEKAESAPILEEMWASMVESQEEMACTIRMRIKQVRS